MGFLQRFLSIGSKKNKKRRAPAYIEPSATGNIKEDRRREEQDSEAAASRLLRSSSSHFAVVAEVDYASLPPIPHPINSLHPTPVGTPSRAASVQSRRTYTVKVHDRRVLACTEFPNANPPLDTPTRSPTKTPTRRRNLPPVTPRDKNRMHTLRQDPSVASLLDMYDRHGQLDSKVFSNTPPADPAKDGHAQVKRSGSTLRQLLGSPDTAARNSTTEGDISWAERFLQEDDVPEDTPEATSPASTDSSFGLETPKDAPFDDASLGGKPDTAFSLDEGLYNLKPDQAFSLDEDPSLNESLIYPTFSSMEVELSTDTVEDMVTTSTEPTTPHRAAEVFGFLLDKDKRQHRMSMQLQDPEERPLPALPITFDADSSADSIPPRDTLSAIPSTEDSPSKSSAADHSGSVDAPSSAGSILHDPPQAATIMNRTPVLVATAVWKEGPRAYPVDMTPSARPPSRIPRGPRGQAPATSTVTTPKLSTLFDGYEPKSEPARNVLRSTTNASVKSSAAMARRPDYPSAVSSGVPRRPQRRTASYGSSRLVSDADDLSSSYLGDRTLTAATPTATKASRVRPPKDDTKENGASIPHIADLSQTPLAKSRLPVTPARSRALFDPPHGATPSPASSSELSPVAQQIMADLRKQRTRAGSRKKNRFTEVITRS